MMKRLKFATAFFLAYLISTSILVYIYIGYALGMTKAFGSYPPPAVKLFLELGYWFISAWGTPLIPIYLLLSHFLDLSGNALHWLTLYVLNGVLLASFASYWATRNSHIK